MREIKFRAWNGQKIIDLYKLTPLAVGDDLECDGLFIPFSDQYKLMQYTGLKDKNGKEIYEGDIVKGFQQNGEYRKDLRKKEFIYVIEICSETGTNLIEIENCLGDYRWYPFVKDTEIIGNIYENPELLEESDAVT